MGIIENIVLKLNDQERKRMEMISSAVIIVSVYTIYRQWILKKVLKDFPWWRQQDNSCPVVPSSSFLYGSTLEYLENGKACLEKWSKLGPVYRVYLFGRLNTVISGTYVNEIGRSDNFTRVEGTYREFYLRQWTGITKSDFSMSEVREAVHKHLALKLNSYASRITKYSDIGLNEALGDLTEPKNICDLKYVINNAVVKVAASIFAGIVLCEDEKLIESFKCFGPAIGAARSDKIWPICIPRVFQNIHMWYIGKFDPYIKMYRLQLANSMKPEIDNRLRGMTGQDIDWIRPNDMLQDLIENYPQPAESEKDIYTFYAGYITWLVFPSVATIGELIASVLHRLLEQPELIDELISEQNKVFGDIDSHDDIKSHLTTVESIRKLVKLDSMCRESFRANNNNTGSDRTNSGFNNVILSNGVVIPPGQHILLNVWVNNHDSKVQKDTLGSHDRFEPYRHLETQLTTTKTGEDFMLFGIGKHVCPARWFVMHVVKTIITLLLRNYDIKSIDDLTQVSHSSVGEVCIGRKKLKCSN